jgi:hypothetical protein
VELHQRRIPPDSRWRTASRGRPPSRASGQAPGGAAATLLPARQSRVAGAAVPGSADEIIANPAGRPERPGRHSCAVHSCTVAAMRLRQPRHSRPGELATEENDAREGRPLVRPTRDDSGGEVISLKEIRNKYRARGPRSIHMRYCGVRDDSGVIVTGAGVTRQRSRQRSDAAENDGRNKNCAHYPQAHPAGGVLARGQPDWSANPREGVR